MTKQELIKALEPFTDEIEILRVSPNNIGQEVTEPLEGLY